MELETDLSDEVQAQVVAEEKKDITPFESNFLRPRVRQQGWDEGLFLVHMDPGAVDATLITLEQQSDDLFDKYTNEIAPAINKLFPFWNYKLFKAHPGLRAYSFNIRVAEDHYWPNLSTWAPAVLMDTDPDDDKFFAQGYWSPEDMMYELMDQGKMDDQQMESFRKSAKMAAWNAVRGLLEKLPHYWYLTTFPMNSVYTATINSLNYKHDTRLMDSKYGKELF